jgi:hypothetical protein
MDAVAAILNIEIGLRVERNLPLPTTVLLTSIDTTEKQAAMMNTS